MNFPKIIVTLIIGYLSFVAYSSKAHAVEDLDEITIHIMEADDDVNEFINRIELPSVVRPQQVPGAADRRVRREHERAGDDMDDGEHGSNVETEHHEDRHEDRESRNKSHEHKEQRSEEVRSDARQEIEDHKGHSRDEARSETEAQQEEIRSETLQQITEDSSTSQDEIRDQQDDSQNDADSIRDDTTETTDDHDDHDDHGDDDH